MVQRWLCLGKCTIFVRLLLLLLYVIMATWRLSWACWQASETHLRHEEAGKKNGTFYKYWKWIWGNSKKIEKIHWKSSSKHLKYVNNKNIGHYFLIDGFILHIIYLHSLILVGSALWKMPVRSSWKSALMWLILSQMPWPLALEDGYWCRLKRVGAV